MCMFVVPVGLLIMPVPLLVGDALVEVEAKEAKEKEKREEKEKEKDGSGGVGAEAENQEGIVGSYLFFSLCALG